MKRKKNPQGAATIFLETDIEKSRVTVPEAMSAVQKQIYLQMSKEEQEKIMAGYGTIVSNLETGETICEFNMENYQPPDWAIEEFARSLLPLIEEFYSNEENQRKYEEWKKQQDQSE